MSARGVQGMTTSMDPVDGIAAARLFHYLGDLFTEMASSDDPCRLESLTEQAVDAIRTIDELLGTAESTMASATRERARWQ